IAGKRLAAGRLVVVDATNVQREARHPLVALARRYHCLPVAIVFDLPERLCLERNRGRENRDFGSYVIRQQRQQLRRSLRGLEREGFRHVFVLSSPEEVDAVSVERQPLWNNLRHEHGPFDVIGDVHGCLDELVTLLRQLGYDVAADGERGGLSARHPEGRKAVFLGDLVDRGPDTPGVLRLVMNSTAAGDTLCVPGNHDMKLMRKLRGRDVRITHGLAESLEQLAREPPEFKAAVPPARMYYAPARPLVTEPPPQPGPRPHDELLDIGDVTGKRVVTTRLHHTVTIREEHAAAALEVMSRFAIDPRWLVYLPPTMSPSETSREPGLLEHPREAFDYYRSNGVARAVLQEKHMGSRAVLVVCRDEAVARRRFGVA